jgi:hypothetical protein
MADSKPSIEAVSSAIEPTIIVSEGHGKTANIAGAKAREVHNVSILESRLKRGIVFWDFQADHQGIGGTIRSSSRDQDRGMEQRVTNLILYITTRIPPLSETRLTVRVVAIFTAFLCACANGYDG